MLNVNWTLIHIRPVNRNWIPVIEGNWLDSHGWREYETDSLTGCESWILADDVNVESNPMADENVGVDSLTGCESWESSHKELFPRKVLLSTRMERALVYFLRVESESIHVEGKAPRILWPDVNANSGFSVWRESSWNSHQGGECPTDSLTECESWLNYENLFTVQSQVIHKNYKSSPRTWDRSGESTRDSVNAG
jgi:hypothetical protein